jgi:hypothetical protein
VRLITQQVQLVPDAIKAIDVPPAPASILAVNPDTRREINLTRLSPRDTSGKDCYKSSGPWRLIRCSVGKIVGKASDADGKTARISFGLGEVADVKGDLHEAKIRVKQNSKALMDGTLRIVNMSAIGMKTTATRSNHNDCGEICGAMKEISNG